MVCAWMRLFIPEKTIWLERKLEFFFFVSALERDAREKSALERDSREKS